MGAAEYREDWHCLLDTPVEIEVPALRAGDHTVADDARLERPGHFHRVSIFGDSQFHLVAGGP